MATIKLTDKTVAAAKAAGGKRVELWDEQTPGLCLRVSETGKKVWIWRYRALDGRQPRLTLGDYSQVHGLRWARDEVEELRVKVRKGGDPAEDRRKAKAEAKAQPIKTFSDLADAYLAACESGEWKPRGKKQRPRTIADIRAQLKRHILPAIGKERVETITKNEVRALLRKMVAAGIGAQTNRVQAVIRQCFAYAISEDRVAINPATGFARLAAETPRARILSDSEMKSLWGALVDPGAIRLPPRDGETEDRPLHVGRPMRIALQLALLLLQRRNEIAGMRTAELDLDQRTWIIPAERMKNGFPHLVPLPDAAVELIRETIKLAEAARPKDLKANDWPVFPSPRDATKSVKPDSVTHAMAHLCAALGIENAAPHDLRRTGSTVMTSERLGISPFIRSKVLGHRGDTGGGAAVSVAHYDANSYAAEKRRALEAWDSLLLKLVGAPPLVNIPDANPEEGS